MAPLHREGVTEFEIRTHPDSVPTIIVEADDLDAFADFVNSDVGPLITDQEFEQTLTITSLNFRAGKWRLNDGAATQWMSMNDQAFQSRINRNEVASRKNDKLRALVRLRQWEAPDGSISRERSIMRVVRHIEGPQRPPLSL